MNTIILGAAGFIGTNLAIELSKERKNQITLIDRNQEKLVEAANLCPNKVYIKEYSLNSQSDFDVILKEQDVVYHLISSTVPATSNQQITKEINDNVAMMSELLEACIRCHVKKIIFLSSGGTVYGIKSMCPLKEEMETYPINSYGMQKVMNEKLLYLYQYMYGLDYRIIRLANPFGPYQRLDGIQGAATTFIYKALKKEKIIVYGDGSVIRDYIYIDDAIRAIINIANGRYKEKVFNVGSGKGIDINQLLKIIESTLETSLQIEYLSRRNVDVPINFLDISRYENIFGKLVNISLKNGIQKTANYLMEKISENL